MLSLDNGEEEIVGQQVFKKVFPVPLGDYKHIQGGTEMRNATMTENHFCARGRARAVMTSIYHSGKRSIRFT
jgi:hypothetical protein